MRTSANEAGFFLPRLTESSELVTMSATLVLAASVFAFNSEQLKSYSLPCLMCLKLIKLSSFLNICSVLRHFFESLHKVFSNSKNRCCDCKDLVIY